MYFIKICLVHLYFDFDLFQDHTYSEAHINSCLNKRITIMFLLLVFLFCTFYMDILNPFLLSAAEFILLNFTCNFAPESPHCPIHTYLNVLTHFFFLFYMLMFYIQFVTDITTKFSDHAVGSNEN